MRKLALLFAMALLLAPASFAQSAQLRTKVVKRKAPGSGLQVNLSWNAPNVGCSVSEVCTYAIYRGPTSGSEVLLISGITATNYQDIGVVSGDSYFYETTAVNVIGQSVYSNEASVNLALPGPPTGLTAVPAP